MAFSLYYTSPLQCPRNFCTSFIKDLQLTTVLIRRCPPGSCAPPEHQLVSLENLAGDILTVMRLRLKRILDYLETSPSTSGGILASLDADTCQWIRSARDVNGASRAAEGAADTGKVAKEPLRSTHGVLLCLARALPRNSRYEVRRHLAADCDVRLSLGISSLRTFLLPLILDYMVRSTVV